jgi:NAD(P)-dependent dehydrogenase (short-subunit alcohol dehydrogenase family)
VRSAALASITVNAILPSTMNTDANRNAEPLADFSRWVPPKDVAELVLLLAADSAAHITGAAIPVYGRET